MGGLGTAYALLKSGSLWSSTGKLKGFAVANPGEAAKIDAYVAALDAGQVVSPPVLATATGRGVVGMLSALAPKAAQPPPVTPPTTTLPPLPVTVGALLLEDDFNGATLDLTRWDVKSRTTKSGTVFDKQHYKLENGCLIIWAEKDAAGVWHSAEVQSLAPAYQYAGPRYMEARAQLPAGQGVWPAPIWEWNAPWGGLGVENDVIENLGKEPTSYHVTVHDSQGHDFGKVIETGVNLSLAPHLYSAAVYADRIDFYFDRVKKQTITKTEAFAAGLADWRYTDPATPMVVLSDLDMGGWAGTPTIAGPAQMLVDYIRVWAL